MAAPLEAAPLLLPLAPTPRPVPVAGIEREWIALWREAAERAAADRQVLTRARTFTIVAYAATPAQATSLSAVIAQTSRRHPLRAILLVNDPAAAQLRAEVSAAVKVLRPNHRQICYEEVLVRAESAAHERLPSIVRHLARHDMPVFLCWPLPEVAGALFADLLDAADRVVVDSGLFLNAAAGLRDVAALAGRGPTQAAFSDLNWGRMTVWRDLTAHFFDPPRADYLDRIQRVRVTHASSSRAQALLYVAWLAGRLSWEVTQSLTPGEGPGRAVCMDGRGRRITVALNSDPRSALPAGALISTVIMAEHAVFSVSRKDDASCVMAVSEGRETRSMRRVLPLEKTDEVSLLAAELDVLGHDRVYEEGLGALSKLLGAQRDGARPGRPLEPSDVQSGTIPA